MGNIGEVTLGLVILPILPRLNRVAARAIGEAIREGASLLAHQRDVATSGEVQKRGNVHVFIVLSNKFRA